MYVLASIGHINRSLFSSGCMPRLSASPRRQGRVQGAAETQSTKLYIFKLWTVSAKGMNSAVDLFFLTQFRTDTHITNYMSFFSSLTL